MGQHTVSNAQGYALFKATNQLALYGAQGYALIKPPSGLSLREVRGYALAQGFNQVSLRSVAGYVLTTPPPPLPLGVTGKQALLNMIVAKSKTTRPTTDFTVDAAEVLTGDLVYNTKVKTYATASSGLLGNMYFRYNRIKLERINIASNAFDLGTATTIYGLLPAINTASGMTLTTDDIEDGPIASTDNFVTLVAKASSYWFIPGNTLTIGKASPSINIPISSDTIDW